MLKLLLLCLGTSGLLALSQRENPAQRINWGRSGHYIRQPMDAFLLIGIIWLTCFAFLRTDYKDSLLSSKLQKNMGEKWLLLKKATF